MLKKEAIEFFHGATELAAALGVSKQAVYQWPDRLPIGRQCQIEIMTRGKLKADRPPAAKAWK